MAYENLVLKQRTKKKDIITKEKTRDKDINVGR